METGAFTFILELLLKGIMIGSVYGLIASGLSLIFGVGKIVNFAHGALLAAGMFSVYFVSSVLGISVYFAIPIGAIIMFFIGFFIQKIVITPVIKREEGVPVLPIILLTAGLTMVMENIMLFMFGADYRTISTVFAEETFQLASMNFSYVRFIAFIVSVLVIIALQLILTHTRLGRAMRAVSQDKEKARLLGVNDYLVYNITFGIGAAITAFAGGVLLPLYYVHPDLGNMFLTKSFIIVVLGGLGNAIGAFAGGIIVGILEVAGAQFVKVTMVQAFIFLIFVAVLVFKPTGLFGRERK
jgi:branched-chain amino acid transport system permease protein